MRNERINKNKEGIENMYTCTTCCMRTIRWMMMRKMNAYAWMA